jgi:hypothetical protein
VKRLLEDPRSRALFDGFGAQWLGLGSLETKTFDTAKFPQMTDAMRLAMYDEARLFFESIVRENRSVVSLVDCDYTFLNGTVAALYGLDKTVTGSRWRKVKLRDANRGGILGMPGILAVTSFPDRTSPVKRGVWVLEQVLGEHVPPPPPNVPALEKQDQQTIANRTLRQRTELHRKDETCANCHKVLDPIGFGLENFDAIGRFRTTETPVKPNLAVNPSVLTTFPLFGGTPFQSYPDARGWAANAATLAQVVSRCWVDQVYRNAVGATAGSGQDAVLAGIDQTFETSGHLMQALLLEFVTSPAFRQVGPPR